jgi:predicted transglutaminase-like cysteine proteinase
MTTVGFTPKQVDTLESIHTRVLQNYTYASDQETHGVLEYWEADAVLQPAVTKRVPIKGDCEEFAMICMRAAIAAGFQSRLVICLDETNHGHCISEVASLDGKQAYYFDNRRKVLATYQSLIGYTFYSVSPWNPTPGETRPWELVAH